MSPRENAHRVYRFGEFSLDLDRGTLNRAERQIHLRPKAFAVLCILIERHGRLVSKAELHDTAWSESVVTDDSLAHCVADIRRALGRKGFDIIQTVPRRGYIFDHEVSHEMAEPPPLDRAYRPYQLGSIAAALVVVALLWVGAGSGGDATVNITTAADTPAVAAGAATPTSDVEAMNEYERGRFFFKRRGAGDIDRAEASFEAALARDASFAEAWTGLSGVYCVKYGQGEVGRDAVLPVLGDATQHAVTLAPDSAEAHVRRAHYYKLLGEDALALQHIESAMMLAPDDVLVLGMRAGELAQHSRFDEAIDLQRRAIRNDPTSALLHHNLVWYLLAAGRNAEAAIEAERYRALNPVGIDDAGELFVDVKILRGNYEQALVLARNMADGPARDRNLAIIHHALGREADADAALARLAALEDANAHVYIAEVYAQRGDTEEALHWLSQLVDAGDRQTPLQLRLWRNTLWLLSPYLIEVRSDRRWKTMYAQVLDARDDTVFVAQANVRGTTGMR